MTSMLHSGETELSHRKRQLAERMGEPRK